MSEDQRDRLNMALCPPVLSNIIGDQDQLQANEQQLDLATERCRAYWSRVTAMAISCHRRGITPVNANPRNLLVRVPPLPEGLGKTHEFHFGGSSAKFLCLQPSSTWRVSERTCCGVDKHEKNIPALVEIGTGRSIPCSFDGDGFRQWIGTNEDNRDVPNLLSVLALGWCYVLSARLVELRGQDARLSYTDSRATMTPRLYEKDPEFFNIDLGDVNEESARWWAAVLAPGEGWKAVIAHKNDAEYLTPWSVSLPSQQSFAIQWQYMKSATTEYTSCAPLSSEKAIQLLARFSLLHGVGSQFIVSLATAMTFPTHNSHGSQVRLPFPGDTVLKTQSHVPEIPSEWRAISDDLPRYMSLSCNTQVVISSLCGMFWEADVPCNLVSPWLHTILNEIPEARGIAHVEGRYHELLAVICGLRQPRLVLLWLGAVASGLTPTILRQARSGQPPLDAVARPWIGCPQSFMDLPGSGFTFRSKPVNSVQRAEVWRLLYLPPVVEDDLHYNSRPLIPWEPCGITKLDYCVHRVTSHLGCNAHSLEYQSWSWEMEDGTVSQDLEFAMGTKAPLVEEVDISMELLPSLEINLKPLDQEASQRASFNVFGWVTLNGEGTPPEKTYEDEWLQFDDESDEDLDMSSESSGIQFQKADESSKGLDQWLGGIVESC